MHVGEASDPAQKDGETLQINIKQQQHLLCENVGELLNLSKSTNKKMTLKFTSVRNTNDCLYKRRTRTWLFFLTIPELKVVTQTESLFMSRCVWEKTVRKGFVSSCSQIKSRKKHLELTLPTVIYLNLSLIERRRSVQPEDGQFSIRVWKIHSNVAESEESNGTPQTLWGIKKFLNYKPDWQRSPHHWSVAKLEEDPSVLWLDSLSRHHPNRSKFILKLNTQKKSTLLLTGSHSSFQPGTAGENVLNGACDTENSGTKRGSWEEPSGPEGSSAWTSGCRPTSLCVDHFMD